MKQDIVSSPLIDHHVFSALVVLSINLEQASLITVAEGLSNKLHLRLVYEHEGRAPEEKFIQERNEVEDGLHSIFLQDPL